MDKTNNAAATRRDTCGGHAVLTAQSPLHCKASGSGLRQLGEASARRLRGCVSVGMKWSRQPRPRAPPGNATAAAAGSGRGKGRGTLVPAGPGGWEWDSREGRRRAYQLSPCLPPVSRSRMVPDMMVMVKWPVPILTVLIPW